jgi:hypothetical protein
MPAVLFELDFLSAPSVEAWLGEESNQKAMADALCDGVLRYLGMTAAVPAPVTPVTPVTGLTPSADEVRGLSADLTALANERDRLLEMAAKLNTLAKKL